MIFGRKSPTVDLTNESYTRWLLAGQPQPIAWFLGLEPEEQGTLAELGKNHVEDICIAIGYAVADPTAADAGIDAETNPKSEAELVRKLAAGMVGKVLRSRQEAPEPKKPLSMGGWTERRHEATQKRQEDKDSSRVLFGRIPDGAAS